MAAANKSSATSSKSSKLNEDFWKKLGVDVPSSEENASFLNNNFGGTFPDLLDSSSLHSVVPPSPTTPSIEDKKNSKSHNFKFTNLSPSKVN